LVEAAYAFSKEFNSEEQARKIKKIYERVHN
jgi:hypothetical protein